MAVIAKMKMIIGVQKEYDPEFKMELEIPIFGKTNIKLEQQISIVEQQA